MDLTAYFDRINYKGPTSPDAETLRQLQRAHLYAVPFENLNIHMPMPIVLDEAALFDKIVKQHRGGFCFEQNGFFAAVLRALGFDVTMMRADVYNAEQDSFSIPFAHLTLMVTLDERYLVDVGFGTAFIEPLRLDEASIQTQEVGQFRIEHDGEAGFYYEQFVGSEAMTLGYRFFFQPRQWSDFADACHYMQTSPKTHFTQKRLCSLPTSQGRITLSEGKFITTTLTDERHEHLVNDEAEFHQILQERFGISVKTRPPNLAAKP